MAEAMRYKLMMFGVPLDGPTNIFYDNEAVYKKQCFLNLQSRKGIILLPTIDKQGTEKHLADLFTKVLASGRFSFNNQVKHLHRSCM
eukprot:1100483-Ditylum_brightwellii.AAC.1